MFLEANSKLLVRIIEQDATGTSSEPFSVPTPDLTRSKVPEPGCKKLWEEG